MLAVRTARKISTDFASSSEVALSGAPVGIPQLLKMAGLCPSTSDAMRMIDQGGVRIDGTVAGSVTMKNVKTLTDRKSVV